MPRRPTATTTVCRCPPCLQQPVLAVRVGLDVRSTGRHRLPLVGASVIHWNVPGNAVDFEQREGRAHKYLRHAVCKNVACRHWGDVLKPGVKDPWETLFSVAAANVGVQGEVSSAEFASQGFIPVTN
jgi:hypothetical protein